MIKYTDEELKTILEQHKLWINTDGDKGECADVRYTDLRGANLRSANLRSANLRSANLLGADLCGADLCGADLCGADLRGANLFNTNLDFSTFPLSCKSFGMIVDNRLVWQLICHLTRLNVNNCSDEVKEVINKLKPYADYFCHYRTDVKRINNKD